MGEGIGEHEMEELVPEWGLRRDKGSWFQRQGEAYLPLFIVILLLLLLPVNYSPTFCMYNTCFLARALVKQLIININVKHPVTNLQENWKNCWSYLDPWWDRQSYRTGCEVYHETLAGQVLPLSAAWKCSLNFQFLTCWLNMHKHMIIIH